MKKHLTIFAVALGLIALPTANYAFRSQDTATQDKKDDKTNHDKMSDDKMDHGKMADDHMSHDATSNKKHKKGDKMDHSKMSDTTSTSQ